MTSLVPDDTLLGILAASPQHGYHLMDYFWDPELLAEVWNLHTSQLYAVMKRLTKQGMVETKQMKSIDGPVKIHYTVTDAGRNRVNFWLNEENPSPSIRRVRVEFLSRLYVARLLKISPKLIIERQQRTCQQKLDELIAQKDENLAPIHLLALELKIAQLESVLAWIERCELMPKDLEDL